MNKYTIEKRDREVVEKFRSVVASKEQARKKARMRMLGGFLIIVCAGLIVFFIKSPPTSVQEPVMNKSKTIVLKKDSNDRKPFQDIDEIPPPEAELIELSAINQDASPRSPAPESPSAEPVIPEKPVRPDPVPVLKPRVQTSGKTGLSELQEQISAKTDIRIADIATCKGVENRQAAMRQNVFSIKEGAQPHVWMDVRSKKTPYRLRHVYYHNGRRYCAVSLQINYPRMRTWSNVTLRHPYEAGQWRVDVVKGKEEILSRVEFTVVP